MQIKSVDFLKKHIRHTIHVRNKLHTANCRSMSRLACMLCRARPFDQPHQKRHASREKDHPLRRRLGNDRWENQRSARAEGGCLPSAKSKTEMDRRLGECTRRKKERKSPFHTVRRGWISRLLALCPDRFGKEFPIFGPPPPAFT